MSSSTIMPGFGMRGDHAWSQLAEEARRIASLLDAKARVETLSDPASEDRGADRLRRLTQLESAILRSLADGKQIAVPHSSSHVRRNERGDGVRAMETTPYRRDASDLYGAPYQAAPSDAEPPRAPALPDVRVWLQGLAARARWTVAHATRNAPSALSLVWRKGPALALIVLATIGLEGAAGNIFPPQLAAEEPAFSTDMADLQTPATSAQTAPPGVQTAALQSDAQQAAQRVTVQEAYGTWALQCFGAPVVRCEMSNRRPNGQNAAIVTANIVRARNDRQDTLNIIGPFGVLLKERARITIDGGYGGGMNVLTCLPTGCVFQLKLDQEMLDNLSQGSELRASFVMSNRQNSNMAISLAGLPDAYIRMSNLLRN